MVENLPPVLPTRSVLQLDLSVSILHTEETHMASVHLEPHRRPRHPALVCAQSVEHGHGRVQMVIPVGDHGDVLCAVEHRVECEGEADRHFRSEEFARISEPIAFLAFLDSRPCGHEQVGQNDIERRGHFLLLGDDLSFAIGLDAGLDELVRLIVRVHDREVVPLEGLAGGLLVNSAVVDDEDLHGYLLVNELVLHRTHSDFEQVIISRISIIVNTNYAIFTYFLYKLLTNSKNNDIVYIDNYSYL